MAVFFDLDPEPIFEPLGGKMPVAKQLPFIDADGVLVTQHDGNIPVAECEQVVGNPARVWFGQDHAVSCLIFWNAYAVEPRSRLQCVITLVACWHPLRDARDIPT